MKQLKVVFSLLLVALLLAGCGTKDTKNVDAAKAADDLKSALTFQDELSESGILGEIEMLYQKLGGRD